MERRVWLGLIVVSLFIAMACSLPTLNPTPEITMRRTVVPLETVQPLVRDAIIVTPHATFTATPTPTITPTLISVAAAQGTMTPSPTLTETVDSAGKAEAEATAAAVAATQTAVASATTGSSPTVVSSPTASTTPSPTSTTSPTSTSTGTPSPTSTSTATPTSTPTIPPTPTVPPTPTTPPTSTPTASDGGDGDGGPADTPTSEPVPQVAFSAASYSVNESVGSATINVILSGTSAQTVTVSFATSDGTAQTSFDYLPNSGTLIFSPGETSKSFDVTIFDELRIESDETIILTLTSASGNVSLGTPNPATLTILNDDGTVVTTTDESSNDGTCSPTHCSLSEAIDTANANVGTIETISFNIPGGGPHTIRPGFALPTIFDPVIIDGTTQPGANCSSWPPTLLIELDGSSAGAGADGLFITAGNSIIRGLVINRFGGDGIELNTNGNNRVECNYIGTDVGGTLDLGNGENGVLIDNVPGNTIGGATAGARNLISGNDDRGVWISGSGASGNQVLGNFIGTDASGTQPLGNQDANIRIAEGAVNNIIGGTAGTTPGGPCTGACNLLADAKIFNGITIGDGHGNTVQGNYIGTDVTGTLDLGNLINGVAILIGSSNNIIGGTTAAARNLISGNNRDGIRVRDNGTTGNMVQGNYIGTDTTGTVDLGNGTNGVRIENASGNTIGGTATGAGNLISGNSQGIIFLNNASSNRIEGNTIGTDIFGNRLGNDVVGIRLHNGNNNNIIGGTVSGAGNIIAYTNSGNGIDFTNIANSGNRIQGNSIFSNGALGIDLNDDGITANDLGDGDTGHNNQQNFPVLTAVTSGTTITGTLNSTANSNFRLEFFANSACDSPGGNGEGETFLGFSNQTTDGMGDVSFVVNFAVVVPSGYEITATATNSTTNDTSEFSACLAVP